MRQEDTLPVLVGDLWNDHPDFIAAGVFTSKQEQDAYVSWRCDAIREDYVLGVTDLLIYALTENDVEEHIESFRREHKNDIHESNQPETEQDRGANGHIRIPHGAFS